MKVYIITTRRHPEGYIGDEHIFNDNNKIELPQNMWPDADVFTDLYRGGALKEEYKFYYKLEGGENCIVIGYVCLPGVNNQQLTDKWKEWLKTLYPEGDNIYKFILHDKDVTSETTSFQSYIEQIVDEAICADTYIFSHPEPDFFSIFIDGLGNDVKPGNFVEKFKLLVDLTRIYVKLCSKKQNAQIDEEKNEINRLLGKGWCDKKTLREIRDDIYITIYNGQL